MPRSNLYRSDHNAFNRRTDQAYQYQYHDIEKISRQLFLDYGLDANLVTFASPLDIYSRELAKFSGELESGKRVVGAYNTGGNHWIAYVIYKDGDGRIKAAYKDSLGQDRIDFATTFVETFYPGAKINDLVYRVGGDEREQTDGVSCGLFTLKNMMILAQTSNVRDPAVKFFKVEDASYDSSLSLLRAEFATKYLNIVFDLKLNDIRRTAVVDIHADEARMIQDKLGINTECVTYTNDDGGIGYRYRVKVELSRREELEKTLVDFLELPQSEYREGHDATHSWVDFTFIEIKPTMWRTTLIPIITANDERERNINEYIREDKLTELYTVICDELHPTRGDIASLVAVSSSSTLFASTGVNVTTLVEPILMQQIVNPASSSGGATPMTPSVKQSTKPSFVAHSVQSNGTNIFQFASKHPKTAKSIDIPEDIGGGVPPTFSTHANQVIAEAFEYIESGSKIIGSMGLRDKVVAFIGITGSGKTTLMNFLGGRELIGYRDHTAWRLKTVDEELFGTHIGHTSKIGTFYAVPYNPPGDNFSYVDLPGSGYVGALAKEISCAYFRQKVALCARQLKIILVIPHDDFTRSAGRGEDLKKAFTELSKFLETVAGVELINCLLVPSQVDRSEYTTMLKALQKNQRLLRSPDLTPEEREEYEAEVLNLESGLANFEIELQNGILAAMDEIKESREDLSDKELSLIDHLKSHMALFFNHPDAATPMPFTQRAVILQKLNEIGYLGRDEYTPAIVLSPDAENVIRQMTDVIGNNIKILAEAVSDIVQIYLDKHFAWYKQNNIVDSKHISGLSDHILQVEEMVTAMASHSADESAFRACAALLVKKIPTIGSVLDTLLGQLQQMQFCVSAVPNPQAPYQFSEWATKVTKILSDKKGECSVALECALFAEELTTKTKAKIENASEHDELQHYLQEVSAPNMAELVHAALITKIRDLARGLDENFEHQPSALNEWGRNAIAIAQSHIQQIANHEQSCTKEGAVVTIKGYILSAHNVREYIIKEYNTGYHPTALRIFALNTVFLDADLTHDRFKGVDVCIIAPYWKIVTSDDSKRVIDISGRDGTPHVPPKAVSGVPPAEDGDGTGNPGRDGLPGNPGGNGGNFIGIAVGVGNSNKLQINVSGGSGGPGQDGGDGSDGRKGQDATRADIETLAEEYLVSREEVTFKQKQGFWAKTGHFAFKTFTYNTKHIEKYKACGTLGVQGGDAGKGGCGGIWGSQGMLEFLCAENVAVDHLTASGNTGSQGLSGRAGSGGKNGQHYQGTYLAERILPGVRGYKEVDSSGAAVPTAAGAAAGAGTAAVIQAIGTTATTTTGTVLKEGALVSGSSFVAHGVQISGISNGMIRIGANEGVKVLLKDGAKEGVKVLTTTATAETGKAVLGSVAASAGLGVVVNGVASLISCYWSSGWTKIGVSDEETGSALDGEIQTELNTQGLEYPDEPSPTFTREQCWADYAKFVEATGLIAEDSPYMDAFSS